MTPQSPSPSVLRLGTRGSKLALAQAKSVQDALRTLGGLATEIVAIRTSGDRILDRPLADIGGKGLFAKELEDALLSGRVDIAVHSMKDLPTALPAGLAIAAIPPREDPSDAFLSNSFRRLEDLPPGSRIGTSSVRRRAQIARHRPDLEIVSMRGNVDTRLAKLDAGEVDAVILAIAGLKRLGLGQRATVILSTETWLPALAQGAIAVEMREQDRLAATVASVLNDEPASIAIACERAFQAALDGTCRTPIAGLATLSDNRLLFRGEVLAPDGTGSADTRVEAELGANPLGDAARIGAEAGLSLKDRARPWLAL